jgi:hypothetical protein
VKGLELTLVATALLALGGCADDEVFFTTGTTVGAKLATQPTPRVAAGYDRVEGYVAPVYPNGEIPQVVASFQKTGPAFWDPINQTYATGPAALSLVTGRNTTPKDKGSSPAKRTVFIGSGTTIGFKVGYTTMSSGPIPETVSLGWDRVEFSLIPLTPQKDGGELYPSAFMSIAGNVDASVDLGKSGIKVSQFIATGDPAVELAAQQRFAFVRGAQETTARSVGLADSDLQTIRYNKLMAAIAPGDVFNKAAYDALVAKAGPTCPGSLSNAIKSATTLDKVQLLLKDQMTPTDCLVQSLPPT